MRKLILAFLLIATVCTLMMPVMADETSPVKSYDTAAEGELLYTVDFSGKDGVMTFESVENSSKPLFVYTPSEDGKAVTVTGAPGEINAAGTHWYAMIPELYANETTAYSMTYKISVSGDKGTDNSVGVGGLFIYKSGSSYLNFYGSYNTNGENNRRGVLQQGSQKIAEKSYTFFSTLSAKYDIDADGYMTIMTVFNGPEEKFSAYLLVEGATDYNKAESWVMVDKVTYVGGGDDCMGFALYTYRSAQTNATIRDVSIYKGMLFDPDAAVEPTEPTQAPTDPTQAPTAQPTPTEKPDEPAEPAEQSGAPIGLIIGIVAGVAVIAAVVIIVLKKKK